MKNESKCAGLFGKTRQAVLSLFYGQPGGAFYTRYILDALGSGRGAVQRELKNLTDSGILTRTKRGNRILYQANPDCSIFAELKSLVEKTTRPKPGFSASRLEYNVDVPQQEIEEFCRRYHVRKLAFFGSVLRDDFGPESDIDVLVEFEPEHVPGLLRLADIEMELARIMGKRKVDLRTAPELSQRFRQRVLNEAEVRYG